MPKHTIWNYKKAKFDEMKAKLRDIPWSKTLINDIESDWSFFKTTLTALCHQFIPKKTLKEIKQPPWLKREILRLVRQKRAAWNRYKNSKEEADLQSCKNIQKEVKKAIKNAKHKHELQISKSAKTNPKLFYSYLSNQAPRGIIWSVVPLPRFIQFLG